MTAAGSGYVAEKIVDAAKGAGVPVYKDEALAATLARLRVGDMIPAEVYGAVAEVLAYIIRADSNYKRSQL